MTARERAMERVERGAEILDHVRPGWAKRIDLEELDIADGWHCVLGQLARTSRAPGVREMLRDGVTPYAAFVEYLWTRVEWFRADRMGFTPVMRESDRLLNEEWGRAIEARR